VYSRLTEDQQKDLVRTARAMTPEQRLKAFAEQSRLLVKMNLAGKSFRLAQTKKRKSK
jgi:hypothetical protein